MPQTQGRKTSPSTRSKAGKHTTSSDRLPEGQTISENTLLLILQRYPLSFWNTVKAQYQQGYKLPQATKDSFPDKGITYTYSNEYGSLEPTKADIDKRVEHNLVRIFKENQLPFPKLLQKIQKELQTGLHTAMYSPQRETFFDQLIKAQRYGVPLSVDAEGRETHLVLVQTRYSDLQSKQEKTRFSLQTRELVEHHTCIDHNGNALHCEDYIHNGLYSQCAHAKTTLKVEHTRPYPLREYWRVALGKTPEKAVS